MNNYFLACKGLVALFLALTTTACSSIYDDLSECPSGQYFRYVYDKTLSGGDAFGAQVGYASLYVYDQDGNFVTSYTEQGSALDQNGYRMQTDLPAGKYCLVSWCQAAPDKCMFTLDDSEHLNQCTNTLNTQRGISSTYLHPLWHWSATELEVSDKGEEYTIRLTKNTNNIRIVLQQIDGNPVLPGLFDFTISGTSRIIRARDNQPSGEVTYKPFVTGQSTVGGDEDGNGQVTVAYAEFSTSRPMADSKARLKITRRDTGTPVLDIPLIDYLLMRSEIYATWSDQEYLDRESEYTLVLFLDRNDQWISSTIIVNGWTVRINDIG